MVGALLVPAHSPFGSILNPFLFGFLVFKEVVYNIPDFFMVHPTFRVMEQSWRENRRSVK